MDDPTISEIPKGVGAELQKTLQEARVKNSPFSYLVSTINMDGKSLGVGTAGKRKELILVIMKNFDASLVFCQELPGEFEKKIIGSGVKSAKNENEAAVLWHEKKFRGSVDNLKVSDRRIINIRDNLQNQGDFDVSEILSRVAMVKLVPLEEQAPNEQAAPNYPAFIAASWHGPHTGHSEDSKRGHFRGLIRFLKAVCQKEGGIPFIIGGDFNFNTLALDQDLDNGVCVPGYELSPRSEENKAKSAKYIPFKDNFIFFPCNSLSVTWTRSFDFSTDFSQAEAGVVDKMKLSEEPVTKTLDHDPVFCVISLTPQDQPPVGDDVARDLHKDFAKVAVSETEVKSGSVSH